MCKIVQLVEFSIRLLGPLLKIGVAFIGNALKPLAKRVLVLIRSTAAASATDVAIQKKNFWSGTTTLIISKEETDYIKEIIKSL